MSSSSADSNQLPRQLQEALARLDELVLIFEQHPDPRVHERVTILLQCVDRIHRGGLRHIAEVLRDSGLQTPALRDPQVQLLFDLYDLGDDGDWKRADAVLDAVRPYIESHGGKLEVIAVDAGEVTVRLSGACHGCPGSAATLRNVVEQTLRDGLSDFAGLTVAEPVRPSQRQTPPNFVPAETLARPKAGRLRWLDVMRTSELAPGKARGIEIEAEPVLVVNLAGEFYAYRNACPDAPESVSRPLDGGVIDGNSIRCPWHGCRFDLRGGKRLGGTGPGLGVMPIALLNGSVRIGILRKPA